MNKTDHLKFVDEYEALCRKHGMSLRNDGGDPFVVAASKGEIDSIVKWLRKDAEDREELEKSARPQKGS